MLTVSVLGICIDCCACMLYLKMCRGSKLTLTGMIDRCFVMPGEMAAWESRRLREIRSRWGDGFKSEPASWDNVIVVGPRPNKTGEDAATDSVSQSGAQHAPRAALAQGDSRSVTEEIVAGPGYGGPRRQATSSPAAAAKRQDVDSDRRRTQLGSGARRRTPASGVSPRLEGATVALGVPVVWCRVRVPACRAAYHEDTAPRGLRACNQAVYAVSIEAVAQRHRPD